MPCGSFDSGLESRHACLARELGDDVSSEWCTFTGATDELQLAGLAGFPVPELYNIDCAQPEAAAGAVAENADMVFGVKVRMSENVIAKHGLEPLNRGVRACEL